MHCAEAQTRSAFGMIGLRLRCAPLPMFPLECDRPRRPPHRGYFTRVSTRTIGKSRPRVQISPAVDVAVGGARRKRLMVSRLPKRQ